MAMKHSLLMLDSEWQAARVGDVEWNGSQLTTTHPPSSPPSSPWMDAVVPGTVLATLLKNKLIPDPFYGLENENIVDIADAGREYYTFWFFRKFDLAQSEQMLVWLHFRGINYQAEVFLNGHSVLLPKGMFQRHTLDITNWIHWNGSNFLAVLVHPPDHPGRIPPEGGQGGDHDIGKDVATQYVEGWDWMCPIRDRNTGIWDQVSVFTTGPVKISDPHLVGSFFDSYTRAYLHTTTELKNTSSKAISCMVKLQVTIELEDSICSVEHLIEKEVLIGPASKIDFTFPHLFFYKPQLWWPNGMGKQPLYKVDISVEIPGIGESDSWSHLFGFRKIQSYIDPSTGGRIFKVNGQPVFIRGGNWIVSDGLLWLSEKRYKTEIDFHADMNFNMIRCWGGGIAERPEFYQNCDRRGILVWQEFWITGDNNGRSVPPSASSPNWPLDHELFLTCARDTIRLLRNNASLAIWVGGNEQHPADDINSTLMNDLQLHPFFHHPESVSDLNNTFVDPSRYLDGTRIYIQGSLWDGFAKGNGEFSDGPYEIQNPEDFFKKDFYPYGFNPEVGSVGTPVAATIRATMPPEAWQPPLFFKQQDGYIKELPNSVWEYHKYIPYSNPGKVHDQIELYGEPNDLDDFCGKAQLVNYVQYRALLEGWTSKMWTKFTGVLIWKNQNPWTGLRGQFYDHLHDQTGGFYGVQSACESIHIQLNLETYFIEVVNTTANPLVNITVESTVWDLNGTNPYHHAVQNLTVPVRTTMSIFEMQYPKLKDAQPVYFLLLKLFDKSGSTVISRNFYWLHLPGGNYKELAGSFKTKKIPVQTRLSTSLTGTTCRLKITVENSLLGKTQAGKEPFPCLSGNRPSYNQEGHTKGFNSADIDRKMFPVQKRDSTVKSFENSSIYSGVAFWIHFSVISENKAKSPWEDVRILPVHYSQNYISLVPGEKTDVEIAFELPDGFVPCLALEGWNVDKKSLALKFG